MTELTYAEFCALPLKYTMGMTTARGAIRVYRNEQLKIQKEVNTKRKRYDDIYGGWGKQTIAFFLDGNGRKFDTLEQVYMAYMQKVCGIKETA